MTWFGIFRNLLKPQRIHFRILVSIIFAGIAKLFLVSSCLLRQRSHKGCPAQEFSAMHRLILSLRESIGAFSVHAIGWTGSPERAYMPGYFPRKISKKSMVSCTPCATIGTARLRPVLR
jgi:hypothetical protein